MEKLANKSYNYFLLKIRLIGVIFFVGNIFYAQTSGFVKGKTYKLDSISVSGIKTFNEQTVISYSGLNKGEKIKVPGEKISAMINKLWALELFSDINVFVTKVNNSSISLELEIVELPTLTNVKINGLKKFYGVSSKEGLEFFEAHKSADVIHRAECEKLLDNLSKDEQEKAENRI